MATFSVDYKELGRSTADLVERILKGEKPGAIPVVTFKGERLYLNVEAAKKMNIEISEDLKKDATVFGLQP